VGLVGDFFSGFYIADRIGMSIEIVQNLFGANRRPTAERGLLAYWRTGSKVVVPEALRYGEVL
jgi:HK97 family phage major capsid protein